MLTQIINAKILTPQGWLKDGSVLMRDNKILEVTNCDLAVIGAELIDAKGMYVVPGGVEIHVHGGGGGDFMEGTEEAFRTAVNAHMKHGTTSIFPYTNEKCFLPESGCGSTFASLNSNCRRQQLLKRIGNHNSGKIYCLGFINSRSTCCLITASFHLCGISVCHLTKYTYMLSCIKQFLKAVCDIEASR